MRSSTYILIDVVVCCGRRTAARAGGERVTRIAHVAVILSSLTLGSFFLTRQG